jgi:putative addiction module CopG family antidote
MDVHLTPIQETFVRQAIDSGRLQQREDAVKEALSLWEERQRRRAEILSALDEAESSIVNNGDLSIARDSMHDLAEDVKRRGRARLASEQKTSR